MKNKDNFIYKFSVVNGTKYLQIWKFNKETKNYDFVLSCGSAEKLYKKLKESTFTKT